MTVSVLMSVFNEKPEYLRLSIESILHQTHPDFELILINDGSDPFTTELLQNWEKKDSRIRLLHNEVNIGLTKSLNRAIREAKGAYIARMDSNDIAFPERLATQLSYLKNNNLDFIGSNSEFIDEEGRVLGGKNQHLPKDLKRRLAWGNIFTHSTFFGKKEVFKHLYNERFDTAQDYEFLLRIVSLNRYKIGYHPKKVLQYRLDRDGISIRKQKRQERSVLKIKWLAWHRYGYPTGLMALSMVYGMVSYCLPGRLKRYLLTRQIAPRGKVLGLFFTAGVSVEQWAEMGILSREKRIYEQWIQKGVFDQIYWFTYGTNERSFQDRLPKGIVIVSKPKVFAGKLGSLLYSFLLPIVRFRALKKCKIYKTNQTFGAWTGVLAKIIFRKPLIVRSGYTSSKNSQEANRRLAFNVNSFVESFAYRFADRAIVTTMDQKNYLKQRHGRLEIEVVPNYIDTDLFKDENGPALPRDIIFVGRLSEEKNLFNLIEAVARTPYSLDLYGKGPLKERLEQKIRDLGKSESIRLMGTVDNAELPRILNRYKLYVLPSFYEGLPKTLLEAMACGVACLGTDAAGIREVIEQGKNGWLVGSDIDSLEQGIRHLMKDSHLRKHLGLGARETIVKSYSLDRIAEEEGKLYTQYC